MKESIKMFESTLFIQNTCYKRWGPGGAKCNGCIQNSGDMDSKGLCYLRNSDYGSIPSDWFLAYPPKEDLLDALVEKFEVFKPLPLSAASIKELSHIMMFKKRQGADIAAVWVEHDMVKDKLDLMVEYTDLALDGTTVIDDVCLITEVCMRLGIINI